MHLSRLAEAPAGPACQRAAWSHHGRWVCPLVGPAFSSALSPSPKFLPLWRSPCPCSPQDYTPTRLYSGPRNVKTEPSMLPARVESRTPACSSFLGHHGGQQGGGFGSLQVPGLSKSPCLPTMGHVAPVKAASALHLGPPSSAAGLVPQVCPLNPQLTGTALGHKVQEPQHSTPTFEAGAAPSRGRGAPSPSVPTMV